MENSDSTSPERALFCREEKDGARRDIYGAFQGLPPHAATAGRLDQRHLELMASKFCEENLIFELKLGFIIEVC